MKKLILSLFLFASPLVAQVQLGKGVQIGSGTGVSQIVAGSNVTVSPANGTGTVTINATGGTQYIAPQAISGCGVEYVSGLTYSIGACTYSINGNRYSSPLSSITLPAADATNPRLDVIYVDSTLTVKSIQGTPAVSPQLPVVDPSTQLQLTFVLVPAASTTPANTTLVNVYSEGTEWTGATGGTNAARVNLTSTSNPFRGTKDTEFGTTGTVAATTLAQYVDPASGTVNMANYNSLVFYIRNKAAWSSTASVTVQWYNGTTAKGTPIVLNSGAFGFNSTTNTTTYQQISIPVTNFGIAGIPVTTLRFTVSGTGTVLTGFYLDEVSLQGGSGGIILPSTLMNFKGSWSGTAAYSPNDTVVNGGVGYVALAANTNVAVTTTATWAPLASGSVGTAGQLQKVGATAGSFAASAITDNGTTVSSSEPVSVNDGTGKAGNFGLVAGTAPTAAPANTIQINAPTAVTAYSVNLPGTQGTGALTNNGSGTLSWSATGGCGTCVIATSPGVGIAHFAGSTQTVTSSAVNLASADVTGLLPNANIANPSTTVNGQTCTLGSSCTLTITTPLYLNWTFNSGAAATDASPRFLASHTGTIATCYALTTASDGATALTFNIFDNGSTIFSGGAQTIAAGTAAGTLTTLGALGTTSITNNDKISINITSGTSSWIFTVSCK